MTAAGKIEFDRKNHAVITRMAARREVRRLRQQKKKVLPELLAQAGFSDSAPPRASSHKRIERVLTEWARMAPGEHAG